MLNTYMVFRENNVLLNALMLNRLPKTMIVGAWNLLAQEISEIVELNLKHSLVVTLDIIMLVELIFMKGLANMSII